MIDLKMYILWENLVQLGIPFLIIVVLIPVAIISVRNKRKRNYREESLNK